MNTGYSTIRPSFMKSSSHPLLVRSSSKTVRCSTLILTTFNLMASYLSQSWADWQVNGQNMPCTSSSDLSVSVNFAMLITKILSTFPNLACVSSTSASKFEISIDAFDLIFTSISVNGNFKLWSRRTRDTGQIRKNVIIVIIISSDDHRDHHIIIFVIISKLTETTRSDEEVRGAYSDLLLVGILINRTGLSISNLK